MICVSEPTPSLLVLSINALFLTKKKWPRSLKSLLTCSASSLTTASSWSGATLTCTISALVLRCRNVLVSAIDVSICSNSFSCSDFCSSKLSIDSLALSSTSLNIFRFFSSMSLIMLSTKHCALLFTPATCA